MIAFLVVSISCFGNNTKDMIKELKDKSKAEQLKMKIVKAKIKAKKMKEERDE